MEFQYFDIHFYIHVHGHSSIFSVKITYKNQFFTKKMFLEKLPLFWGSLNFTIFDKNFELSLIYSDIYVPLGCSINFQLRDNENTDFCADFDYHAILK